MCRGFIVALSVAALAGCAAPSTTPALPTTAFVNSAVPLAQRNVQRPQAVTLAWSPTSITMTDGGPYADSTLSYTTGDTLYVDYYAPCNYHIDLQIVKGPVKNGVESDGYYFYAYAGKRQPPYHCTVLARLKDAGGHVVAHAGLNVTITYPRHHPHGG